MTDLITRLSKLDAPDREVRCCNHCGKDFSKHHASSAKKWAKQRYCSQACGGRAANAAKILPPSEMLALLKSKCSVNEAGCWEYSGAKSQHGYPSLSWRGQVWKGHRLMWTLMNGPISPEEHVCHRCDNRLCVNPGHLFLGDNTVNTADRNRKNRQAKGERQGKAKLTEDNVREILRSNEPHTVLAARFGVGETAIFNVRTRKNWVHVKL